MSEHAILKSTLFPAARVGDVTGIHSGGEFLRDGRDGRDSRDGFLVILEIL